MIPQPSYSYHFRKNSISFENLYASGRDVKRLKSIWYSSTKEGFTVSVEVLRSGLLRCSLYNFENEVFNYSKGIKETTESLFLGKDTCKTFSISHNLKELNSYKVEQLLKTALPKVSNLEILTKDIIIV